MYFPYVSNKIILTVVHFKLYSVNPEMIVFRCFAIIDSLHFPMNFKINLSISSKDCQGNCDRTCVEGRDQIRKHCHSDNNKSEI